MKQPELTVKIGELFGIDIDRFTGWLSRVFRFPSLQTDITPRETLKTMKGLCNQDTCCQAHNYQYQGMMRITARELTAGRATDHAKIGAIFNWVLSHTKFYPDPQVKYKGRWVDSDYLKSPCRIFWEIENNQIARCDCDDHGIIIAGLLKKAGFQPEFLAVSGGSGSNPNVLDHVLVAVYCKELKQNLVLDPQGWDPRKYKGKVLPMSA